MKKLQNLVAVVFATLTLLTAGCASPSFHPGYVQASEEDRQEVKDGKPNKNAGAQFGMGRIDPETGEKIRLDPKDVTVVLMTAISCQEIVGQILAGAAQSTFRGAGEGAVVGGGSTGSGYEYGYTRQIMPDKSNFTLGADIGLAIGGITGAYNGYTQGGYDRAEEIASCLRQVYAQNKSKKVGTFLIKNLRGKNPDAPLPYGIGLDQSGRMIKSPEAAPEKPQQ